MGNEETSGTVPLDLTKDDSIGRGKLSYLLPKRSAEDDDTFVLKIKVDFDIVTIDQARAWRAMFPNADQLFQKAYGDTSDGGRDSSWKPSDRDCKLVVSTTDGHPVFEGQAEAGRGVLKVGEKRSRVVLEFKLIAASLKSFTEAGRALGHAIDIEASQTNRSLPFPERSQGEQAPLPSKTEIKLHVGSLVSFRDDLDDVCTGVITDTFPGSGEVEVRALFADSDGFRWTTITSNESVEASVPFASAKGGKYETALESLRKAAKEASIEVTASDLIIAIGNCSGRGLIERTDDGRWPVTSEVIELTLEIAAGSSDDQPSLSVVG